MNTPTPDLTAMALDIADESEACYLESTCSTVTSQGKQWFDVTPFPDKTDEALYGASMRRAIHWLTLRGILERHPKKAHLVRITRHDMGNSSLAPFETL